MKVRGVILGGLAGAVLFYLLDPKRGQARRAQLRDQVDAASRRITQVWSGPPVDEVDLKQRVESEIFRDPEVPKGDINLDVRGGVVVLRGQVRRPEQIDLLERDVRRVPGVTRVENLLSSSS